MSGARAPRVRRLSGVAEAGAARGALAVIDVLRAFTTAAWAIERGACELWLAGEVAQAFELRRAAPGVLLAGEVGGRPIDGFDLSNSPDEMSRAELGGRIVVLRSSSGTQGALRAAGAERVFLASLVVASATARALAATGLHVDLLALGSPEGDGGREDEACAELLELLLGGGRRGEPLTRRLAAAVRDSAAGRLAADPSVSWISPADLERALEFDRFDFALAVERTAGPLGPLLVARRG